MSEELLTDGVALHAREVVVVPGREFVVARALCGRELIVPALREDAGNALDPLLHFVVLGPCAPALGRPCLSVLAQGELRCDAGIYWLHARR